VLDRAVDAARERLAKNGSQGCGFGRILVFVTDSATESGFELVVEDRIALDVYYHPYAYAALRGVEFGVAA
jgi:hypothetical protein